MSPSGLLFGRNGYMEDLLFSKGFSLRNFLNVHCRLVLLPLTLNSRPLWRLRPFYHFPFFFLSSPFNGGCAFDKNAMPSTFGRQWSLFDFFLYLSPSPLRILPVIQGLLFFFFIFLALLPRFGLKESIRTAKLVIIARTRFAPWLGR